MSGRHVDFDAAWREQADRQGDPPSIRVLGEVTELPRSMPAKWVFLEERHRRENPDRTATIDDMRELLGVVVGDAEVDRWIDAGLGIDELVEVWLSVKLIYAEVVLQRTADGQGSGEPDPESPAPATGAPDSSRT